jgi:hypothetical protein
MEVRNAATLGGLSQLAYSDLGNSHQSDGLEKQVKWPIEWVLAFGEVDATQIVYTCFSKRLVANPQRGANGQ